MQNYTPSRLLEPHIKALILNHLVKKNQLIEGQTIINEFTLNGYTRRVDLVLCTDKSLIAIEIKSEADSLVRLEGQTSKYLEYFDKVIIVAASKHVDNVIKSVPNNVAVWAVENNSIKIKQRGKIIPIIQKSKFIDLMKSNELLKLARRLGLSNVTKTRRAAIKALEAVHFDVLKKAAISNIQERFDATCSLYWQSVKNCQVLPEHIQLLSPYKEQRVLQKNAKAEKDLFWSNWAKKDTDLYLSEISARKNVKMFGTPPKYIKRLIAA
jgi:hypothetical protein